MMMKWLSRMEVFGFIATLLAISGVVMNNYKFRWCFVVWVLSNAITGLLHWRVRIWSLLARDIVFIILAIAVEAGDGLQVERLKKIAPH